MPVSKVYLDDDNNIVSETQATQAVETITDDQGAFVEERWLSIPHPDSLAADRVKIVQDAQRLAGGSSTFNLPLWAIIVIVVLLAVLTYVLLV